MFVIPKPGALVRDPLTRRELPATGREVPESAFWLRRLRAGDVARATPAVVVVDQIPDSPERNA